MKDLTKAWLDAAFLDIESARRLVEDEFFTPVVAFHSQRYPGEFGLLPYGKPTLEDAREFYRFAQDIYTSVCARLKAQMKSSRLNLLTKAILHDYDRHHC